jgi:hypothetical protein
MANVDPFIIQWPQKWVRDPEIGPVVTYLNRFLHDLYLRTGGGNDAIAAQSIRESYAWLLGDRSSVESTQYSVTVSSTKENVLSTATSVTLTGYESLVIVTAAATITLNPRPAEHETVTIKRAGAGTVVLSSSLNIDGAATYNMVMNYEAVDLVYSLQSGWLIV